MGPVRLSLASVLVLAVSSWSAHGGPDVSRGAHRLARAQSAPGARAGCRAAAAVTDVSRCAAAGEGVDSPRLADAVCREPGADGQGRSAGAGLLSAAGTAR